MKYYLAGPMTGLPDYNYPAFEAVAETLRARGLEVYSPHEVGKHLTESERTEMGRAHWLRLNFRGLLSCGGLVLMPGWETAPGAISELNMALDLNMEVWVLNLDGSMIPITNKGVKTS